MDAVCKHRHPCEVVVQQDADLLLVEHPLAEHDGLATRRHNKKGEAIMVNVIIGTETWLNSTINSNEIIKSALGFNVYRKDRPNKS